MRTFLIRDGHKPLTLILKFRFHFQTTIVSCDYFLLTHYFPLLHSQYYYVVANMWNHFLKYHCTSLLRYSHLEVNTFPFPLVCRSFKMEQDRRLYYHSASRKPSSTVDTPMWLGESGQEPCF